MSWQELVGREQLDMSVAIYSWDPMPELICV